MSIVKKEDIQIEEGNKYPLENKDISQIKEKGFLVDTEVSFDSS